MLLIFPFMFQQVAFAGGDISEEDLKKHTHLCHNESQGDSCLVLAEQTLCGRGYNEETAAIMNVACSSYKTRCTNEDQSGCHGYYVRCVLPCFRSDASDVLESAIGNVDVGRWVDPNLASCMVSAEDSKDAMLKYFDSSCNSGKPVAKSEAYEVGVSPHCEIMADVFESLDVRKSILYLENACEMNDPQSCMKLGNVLRERGSQMESKACSLVKNVYEFSSSENREMCTDYKRTQELERLKTSTQ